MYKNLKEKTIYLEINLTYKYKSISRLLYTLKNLLYYCRLYYVLSV